MGYSWEGMKKISVEEANRRYREGEEVFILYDDDTEGAIEDENVFNENWIDQVEFGVEY